MAKLDVHVECITATDGWLCQVTVRGGAGESHHSVTLTRGDFQRLASGGIDAEGLVRLSFEFLLEREPKESILRAFDLPAISRYFPEYEREIRRRLRG